MRAALSGAHPAPQLARWDGISSRAARCSCSRRDQRLSCRPPSSGAAAECYPRDPYCVAQTDCCWSGRVSEWDALDRRVWLGRA
eukprot:4479638-Prymnesium_polylepis.1